MGANIEFAIGYAIGFCIVGVIVFLRYEKKLDRMRQANVNLILDKMSFMSDASDEENGTYNREETRSDVKDAVKYAMKKVIQIMVAVQMILENLESFMKKWKVSKC